jgi:hypothetical protein
MLSDGPLVGGRRDQLKSHDHRFAAAEDSIVLSHQFREVRGKEMAADD